MIEWNDPLEQRPIKADFALDGGCLDAVNAWKHFGGLSRDAAYKKFCESPLCYQEDFMFMGGVAFAYYFPVLERYLLETRADSDNDVEAMWILASCMKAHTEATTVGYDLRARILKVANHVRQNLAQYSLDPDKQTRIGGAWREVENGLGHGHIFHRDSM